MQEEQKEQWTEIISARSSWFDLRLDELWRYRDLVMLFVWRDFVAVYKQTILGPLWHIIQPLFTTITFTIVFGMVARIPTDGIPPFLFYMAGITVWNYFAGCLTKTSNTFVSNAQIFGKVYFPRLTVPVATVISGLLAFGIQLGLFLCFWLGYYFSGYKLQINLWILLVPYLVLLMSVLGLGLGIIVSSLTTKYRDLTHLVAFGVQLAMYATPIIYPLSVITSERGRFILGLNPITPIVEGFRYAFLGQGSIDGWALGYTTAVTLFIFLIGVALFHKVEKSFMDTV
jgi:lipopolysaccharide transport system permease protein